MSIQTHLLMREGENTYFFFILAKLNNWQLEITYEELFSKTL